MEGSHSQGSPVGVARYTICTLVIIRKPQGRGVDNLVLLYGLNFVYEIALFKRIYVHCLTESFIEHCNMFICHPISLCAGWLCGEVAIIFMCFGMGRRDLQLSQIYQNRKKTISCYSTFIYDSFISLCFCY